MSSNPSCLVVAAFALAACAAAPVMETLIIPDSWRPRPPIEPVRELSLDAAGNVTLGSGPRRPPDVHIARDGRGDRLVWGGMDLTPPFPAIDSFDVSDARKEVVFSAKRADNFDIGLVALEGSEIHWVPEDRADETGVRWAPRGNKVSYLVHARSSDLVRTVHIPTATQLTVELPPTATASALAWDPGAERFAVAYDTVDASSQVEVMKYGGESRKVVVSPRVQLDVEVESVGGAVVLRPRALRYGERLPLVIWVEDTARPHWDEARGELQRLSRVACAIVAGEPDSRFREAIAPLPWIDLSRVYIVGGAGTGFPRAISIRGTDVVPAGRYRVQDNSVLVAPAIVKSFAARFIAEQMKGISPANGSSH